MQKMFLLVAGLSILALMPGCNFFGSKEQLSHTASGSLIVINVLDKNIYNDAHIKGSINVPLMELAAYAAGLDKNKEVVVYCANYACSASKAACKELKKMGFAQVWAYEGGTAEWYQLGFPIKGPAQQDYLKAPNAPLAKDEQIPTIEAQELKSKMEAAGLLA